MLQKITLVRTFTIYYEMALTFKIHQLLIKSHKRMHKSPTDNMSSKKRDISQLKVNEPPAQIRKMSPEEADNEQEEDENENDMNVDNLHNDENSGTVRGDILKHNSSTVFDDRVKIFLTDWLIEMHYLLDNSLSKGFTDKEKQLQERMKMYSTLDLGTKYLRTEEYIQKLPELYLFYTVMDFVEVFNYFTTMKHNLDGMVISEMTLQQHTIARCIKAIFGTEYDVRRYRS
jgi:hypothetical protein